MTPRLNYGAVSPNGMSIAWRGNSGHLYRGREIALDRFFLRDDALCLLVRQGRPLWSGSAHEIIADQASRQRFRDALAHADLVVCFSAPNDPVERMSIACDIEAGQLADTRDAA